MGGGEEGNRLRAVKWERRTPLYSQGCKNVEEIVTEEERRAVYEQINSIKTRFLSEYGIKAGNDLVFRMGDFLNTLKQLLISHFLLKSFLGFTRLLFSEGGNFRFSHLGEVIPGLGAYFDSAPNQ